MLLEDHAASSGDLTEAPLGWLQGSEGRGVPNLVQYVVVLSVVDTGNVLVGTAARCVSVVG